MTLDVLKSKAAFSNVVTEDQIIERYKGLAIVKSEKKRLINISSYRSRREYSSFSKKSIKYIVVIRLIFTIEIF